MIIFPAIDLQGGRVVRLTQGDYGRMDVYDHDPLAVMRRFRALGATHLHVVDLDGARDGSPQNREAVGALVGEGGLFVQVGGGLRDAAAVESAFSKGVQRVILGTAALRDTAFLKEMLRLHGDRIAVGVDARDGKVAVNGWFEISDADALDFCRSLRDMGVRTVIYTDIARDGELSGPNLPAYRALCGLAGLDIVASGGVGGEEDVIALREIGVHGAIIGKALYTGRIGLARALRLAEGGSET